MTSRRDNTTMLVIECGVAQTRAGLVKNDEVERVWFGAALGDEPLDQTPQAGRQYFGRVTAINASLNAAFIDLGSGGDGYLALSKKLESTVNEGAVIRVEIKSPPRQRKGAVVKFVSSDELKDGSPGRCSPFQNPVIEALNNIGATATEILIDDGKMASQLRNQARGLEINHYTDTCPLFESFGIEPVLEEIFERSIDIAGGGRLIIDEAQALTAIDVDTAGLSALSSERLREKIAVAAAHESMRQIKRRNIGGHVVIDFPKLKSDISRNRFAEILRNTMSQIDGASGFSFSKSGLFSMTVPHRYQSFSERFTEIDSQNPIPGRYFSVEWQAQSAIRKLEHRLRANPTHHFHLQLGEALFNYIHAKDEWLRRLQERYSVRFSLILDEKRMKSHFEITEQ